VADDKETGLPASMELAWGLRERPTKGPKPGLTLERIVEAAVELAVTDGLAAVSMSRVASAVGASTMALYRYVAAKDELLALMVDFALGPPPAPRADDEPWRDALSRWAWTYLGVLRRNRWALRVPIGGLPSAPNQVAWLDHGLDAMQDTGLAEHEKASVVLMLSGLVRGQATLEADLDTAGDLAEDMASFGALIRRLTDAGRFPALHAAVDAGVFDTPDPPDDEFEFALGRTLDGIEALVRERG
jgi:AcrR family transcriptional regulator